MASMTENARQLIDELARVEEAGDAAPVRRALQTILFDMVERVWAGDPDVAAQYLELMEPVLPRIRAVLATLPEEPSTDAARYAYSVMQALQVADRALGSARIEVDLASVSSEIKRDVLRVLFSEGVKRHLSRDDIHKHLKRSHGRQLPTPTRIGQILVELYALNLVTRVEFARQGNSRTAHYHLTPPGRQLCTRLFRDEQEEAQGGDTWISEAEQEEYLQRRTAAG